MNLMTLKQWVGLQYYRLRIRFSLWREKVDFLRQVAATDKPRVVIGSSGVFNAGWIPSNYQYLNLLNESHWIRAFGDRKVDALLAEHVWEHLSEADGLLALKLAHKYMREGARLRLAVPDGYCPNADYIEKVKPGGTGEGSDDHRVLYNVNSLEKIMLDAGFSVERIEFYDAKGQFHRVPWDPADGMVHRSSTHDERNFDGQLVYTSLILDGFKK